MQAWAPIGGALIGACATIGVALINKYGFWFWRRQRSFAFSGQLHVLRRISGTELIVANDDPPLAQSLHRARLVVRADKKCALTCEYRFQRAGEIVVVGKLRAEGDFHGRSAFLHYRIDDESSDQYWFGIMLLSFPDWGNPFGYLLTESVIDPGKSALLHAELTRV